MKKVFKSSLLHEKKNVFSTGFFFFFIKKQKVQSVNKLIKSFKKIIF